MFHVADVGNTHNINGIAIDDVRRRSNLKVEPKKRSRQELLTRSAVIATGIILGVILAVYLLSVTR